MPINPSRGASGKRFTPHQVETAIQVAMESKAVKNWVESEMKFVGANLNTPEGRACYGREARAAARRLLGLD